MSNQNDEMSEEKSSCLVILSGQSPNVLKIIIKYYGITFLG